MSLLSCEVTKHLVMQVDFSDREDREIVKKSQKIEKSFRSPSEAIAHELARLTEGETTFNELRHSLRTIIKYSFHQYFAITFLVRHMHDSSNFHRLTMEKVFENVSLDLMTKMWMDTEFNPPGGHRSRSNSLVYPDRNFPLIRSSLESADPLDSVEPAEHKFVTMPPYGYYYH